MTDRDDLDTPIWGARVIAEVAGCFKEDGTPDERRGFYLIESGLLGDTVKKVGGRHVSTRRRILAALTGEPV